MAMSGSFSNGHADGYAKVIVDWSAEHDPYTRLHTITFKIYLDTSTAYGMTTAASTSNKSYLEVRGTRYYFTTPSVSGLGKHLLATVVTINASVFTDITCHYHLYFDNEVTLRKTYLKYEKFSGLSSINNRLTLDELKTQSRITSVTGERVLTFGKDLENTLVIEKADSSYTHSIEYTCGAETVNVCEKTSDTNITVNLPISLACGNTSGMTVKVTYKILTFWGEHKIDIYTYTVNYTIPEIEETKPSCTVKVTDGEAVDGVRIFEKYGAYVQRKSRLNVVITPVLAYDSPIVTCSAVVNDSTYVDEYEFETGVLKYSGEQSITVTLTDQRGRIGEVVIPINVLEYQKPSVSNVNIYRCDVDGTANSSGGYLKVTFDAEITPLNGMNSASYELEYQTTSGLHQDGATLTEYAGLYSVSGGSFIFAADNNSVYTAVITAIDDLDKGAKSSGRSLITVLMNILASGLGLAFGTIAGLENVFESAFKFFPSGGFMFPTLEAGSDIYGIKTPNIYSIEEGQDIEHFPVDGSCTLIVLPGGGTKDLLHIVITGTPEILIARITDSSWSSWYRIGMTEVD